MCGGMDPSPSAQLQGGAGLGVGLGTGQDGLPTSLLGTGCNGPGLHFTQNENHHALSRDLLAFFRGGLVFTAGQLPEASDNPSAALPAGSSSVSGRDSAAAVCLAVSLSTFPGEHRQCHSYICFRNNYH